MIITSGIDKSVGKKTKILMKKNIFDDLPNRIKSQRKDIK